MVASWLSKWWLPILAPKKLQMYLESFAEVVNRQRKKKLSRYGKNMKFIIKSLFVCLFLPTQNWRTIGPLIITLVPKDSKCSKKHPQILRFSIQRSNKQNGGSVKYHQDMLMICTTRNDLRLVQLFDQCSSRSWSTATMSKGGCS